MRYKKTFFSLLIAVIFGVQLSFTYEGRPEPAHSATSLWDSFKNIAIKGNKKPPKKPPVPYTDFRFVYPSPICISMGHTDGKGIGHDEGYTSLEAMLFLPNLQKRVFPFVDLKSHLFNDGKYAINTGLGIRFVPAGSSKILGLNVYYDYRKTFLHSKLQQIGAGAEFLSSVVDFRINGYFPLKKWQMIHYCYYDGYEGGYFIERKQFEYVLTGVDGEIGFTLFNNEKFLLYGALGSYYLGKNSCFSTIVGGKIRFELIVRQILYFEASVTYDEFYKVRGEGQVILRVPLGPRKYSRKMIEQPVQRNVIISAEQLCKWRANF